tara:strand:+ start:248 stop:421 length:174 start_codon:yes stop_codon:yes gene_type:complete
MKGSINLTASECDFLIDILQKHAYDIREDLYSVQQSSIIQKLGYLADADDSITYKVR